MHTTNGTLVVHWSIILEVTTAHKSLHSLRDACGRSIRSFGRWHVICVVIAIPSRVQTTLRLDRAKQGRETESCPFVEVEEPVATKVEHSIQMYLDERHCMYSQKSIEPQFSFKYLLNPGKKIQ